MERLKIAGAGESALLAQLGKQFIDGRFEVASPAALLQDGDLVSWQRMSSGPSLFAYHGLQAMCRARRSVAMACHADVCV